ncbi:MAG TPA: RHS repeat domain-containing protein [Blastocatellia bacterium]|nr:RHS repeat domain-containing protein [Blastocatellia bacterium]
MNGRPYHHCQPKNNCNRPRDKSKRCPSTAGTVARALTSETYPSGKVVVTEYDAAGRLAGVKDAAKPYHYAVAAATDAANRIQYAAHGAVAKMELGSGLWEQTSYNSRLQPTQVWLACE